MPGLTVGSSLSFVGEAWVGSPDLAPQVVVAGLPEETDSAFTVGKLKARAVGLITEANSALALVIEQIIAAGLATEADSVLAATVRKSRAAGLPEETDSSLLVAHTKARSVGLLTESDSVLATTKRKLYVIGLTAETDEALDAASLKTMLVGIATETDSALAGTVVVVIPPFDPWAEGKTILPLDDITGLVEWVDYIPVEAAALNPGRFDVDGAFPVVRVLGSPGDFVAWVDYIPVYVVSRTRPWTTETDGYTPFEDVTT